MSRPAKPVAGPAQAEADSAGGAARRGSPRSKDADRAILAAAGALLAEGGFGALSIEEVAARSGVAKTTIYRRWPSRGTLALDAFLADFQSQQPSPDTGTLPGDLLAALRAWIRAVTRARAGPILAALIAESQRDPELEIAWRARVAEHCGPSPRSF
jgi:AcrR family transcriptional regulator